MINFVKRYYTIIFAILTIAMIFYQYHFIRKFKSSYKQDGLYAIGTIKKINGYGRGTGFNFIYTFIVNGKKFTSVCDIGDLSFSTAQKEVDKKCLIIYLNNDVHNNRLYPSIPLNDSLNNDIKIRKWIDSNSKVKSKIDPVPSPGYFLQNYF
ncbi:hypothetical protein MP478_08565 [Chryseobacterium sp. WG14]|uniref:hypothetical protein n=1 Tax=unclassified Chryseobacterium TaxID=2593645 RepID=UPI00211E5496|nr:MULTISPECIES: hypothetical protein [unclassified Chryseobacterium]MCQ9637667.1 hypothetical protein [Chryseobacterium sp. WG23]MCQ9639443.1 hypothetical protein [Chryseobacterium sp. WG14]